MEMLGVSIYFPHCLGDARRVRPEERHDEVRGSQRLVRPDVSQPKPGPEAQPHGFEDIASPTVSRLMKRWNRLGQPCIMIMVYRGMYI